MTCADRCRRPFHSSVLHRKYFVRWFVFRLSALFLCWTKVSFSQANQVGTACVWEWNCNDLSLRGPKRPRSIPCWTVSCRASSAREAGGCNLSWVTRRTTHSRGREVVNYTGDCATRTQISKQAGGSACPGFLLCWAFHWANQRIAIKKLRRQLLEGIQHTVESMISLYSARMSDVPGSCILAVYRAIYSLN